MKFWEGVGSLMGLLIGLYPAAGYQEVALAPGQGRKGEPGNC